MMQPFISLTDNIRLQDNKIYNIRIARKCVFLTNVEFCLDRLVTEIDNNDDDDNDDKTRQSNKTKSIEFRVEPGRERFQKWNHQFFMTPEWE